ncbi:MAG: threonylcarbamoyl-AMP synthase [Spirochaetes bacterium]|nr:threonylcarbamoyl-AMP synthase [Spirochaetota bacterium]
MNSEILEINDYNSVIIKKIAAYIKKNKIVIMPSDTVYGFLALPKNEKKLRQIKKRDDKPFLYLINEIGMLSDLCILNDLSLDILNKYWPGPFTFILDDNLQGIGVRMPDSDALRKIIKQVNSPLISTSVNYSGEEALNDIKSIINEFQDKADLIILDKNFISGTASAVVDLRVKPYKILRKGSRDFHD